MELPLTDTLYRELRTLAAAYLRREPKGSTLQATAVLHDAFVRLCGEGVKEIVRDREHFFALAAVELRRVLVQHARRRRSRKRGGGWGRVTLSTVGDAESAEPLDLIALDDALVALAAQNPDWARVVELRYFGGLTEEETARVLSVDDRTVRRRWVAARAWLLRSMDGSSSP